MKRVFLTGHKGFIGTYLEKRLSSDYNVVGASRQSGVDICNYDTLKRVEEPIDIIVHAAAMASDDYEACFETNVLGTLNICKYAKEKQIKHLVLISTIFAYDEKENGYFNSYGQTKKMAEDVAASYCKENDINLTILRLGQVYDDARLAQSGQAMLYYFIDTIREKREITLFGQENPLRNYIHIDYVCDVIEEILGEQKVGIWGVLEEKNHTIGEIAYMLFEIFQIIPKITSLCDKPNIPSVYIPRENRYVSQSFQSIPLLEGMKRIINYDK